MRNATLQSPRSLTSLFLILAVFVVTPYAFSGDDPKTAEKYSADRETWSEVKKKESKHIENVNYLALTNLWEKKAEKFGTDLFKEYASTRKDSWKTVNKFFATLIGWINNGGEMIQEVSMNNLNLKPAEADRSEVRMKEENVEIPKDWSEVLNRKEGLLLQFLNVEKVEKPKHRYQLGLFLLMNGFEEKGHELLAERYSKDDGYREKINSFYAMRKNVKVPEKGFQVYRNRVVTEAEKKKLKEQKKKAESDKWVKYKGEYIRKEEYMKKTGKVKYKGEWMSEEKMKRLKKKERKKRLKRMVKFDLVFAIKPDASKKKMKDLAGRIKESSKLLYELTYGQMVFRDIVIKDGTTDGDVYIPHLSEYVGPRTGNGRTRIFFDFSPALLIHEFGHLKLGLPDEYKTKGGDRKTLCDACIMGQMEDDLKFCDGDNHTASGASCWDRMLKKFDKLKYNEEIKKKDYDNPPEPKIEYRNN